MKIKKFSEKPSDIDNRTGAKPIVCYPNSTVEEGQKINLAIDPTKLHYFDPDTGLAIT